MRRLGKAGGAGVALAALVFGGPGLYGCSKHDDAVVAAPKRVGLNWDETRSHVFELELTTTSELTGAPTAPALILKSVVELGLRGPLDSQQARITLLHPRFTDASGHTDEQALALGRALETPFAIELSHGLITAYLEPAGTPEISGFRRQIAAIFQLAEHLSSPAWQGLEWDATGLANVEYQARSSSSATWDFKKLGYARVVFSEHRAAQTLDTKQVTPKVETSRGQLSSDAFGIVSATRDERLSVPLSSSATLATRSELVLKRTGFGPATSAPLWQSSLASLVRAEVGHAPPPLDRKLEDQARIGSHTFPEVVGALTELETKSGESRPPISTSAPLFHALVGIFRQQPETVAAAIKRARSRDPISDTLLDGLAMASTEPALQALSELAFDPSVPQASRLRAAGSLIRAQEPTPSAFESVVKMVDDPLLSQQGLYGVGSFTRQLREKGNGALAAAGAQVLLRQLQRTASASDLASVLLAISNSGSGELLQPVVGYQNHADPAVRHAALQAVRLMPQPEAEARLREALSRTDRTDVIEALHALGRRPNATRESVDRVEAIAKNDPSGDVRREAVLVLGLWSQFWPELAPLLTEIHERDPEPRVREVAKPLAVQ